MTLVTFDIKILWLALVLSAGTVLAQPVDLVLHNGKIVTLEPGAPQARGLAARGGRIVAVGSNQTVDALIGPSTRVVHELGLDSLGFTELGAALTQAGYTVPDDLSGL